MSFLPVFASVHLHNIPLTQDGTVSNAQIMGKINSLRKEMTHLLPSFSRATASSTSTALVAAASTPSTPGRRLPPRPLSPSTTDRQTPLSLSPAATFRTRGSIQPPSSPIVTLADAVAAAAAASASAASSSSSFSSSMAPSTSVQSHPAPS